MYLLRFATSLVRMACLSSRLSTQFSLVTLRSQTSWRSVAAQSRRAFLKSNYFTRRGFCNTNQTLCKGLSLTIGYATQQQTCSIEKSNSRLYTADSGWSGCYREARAPARDRYSPGGEADLQLGNMMAQNSAPLAAAINALQNDVDGIKCRLPKTEVIPATPDYVAINRSINIPYGPYCTGFGGF